MLRTAPVTVALALAAAAGAQNFNHAPYSTNVAGNDLNATTTWPLGTSQCRVQFWYGAEELESTACTATGLSLRYDGPMPASGNPGPHAITRLRLRLGVSRITWPGAAFAANLTQPLQQVCDGPWSYRLDPGTAALTPFGDPNGSLSWTFAQPVALTLPPGSWLVVEFVVEGNLGAGMGHASLDAFAGSGDLTSGSASSRGSGCTVPGAPQAALINTFGNYAPGAAYALHGTNLGANAAVLTSISLSDQSGIGPLPFPLPGTSCHLYTGCEVLQLRSCNAAGTLVGTLPGTWISVPADARFNGMRLFHQHLAVAFGANPFGIVPSNYREVVLGSAAAPLVRVWTAGNDVSASAEAASYVSVRAPALRLLTQ